MEYKKILIAATIICILVLRIIPQVKKPTIVSAQTACTSNLEQIKRKKIEWALDKINSNKQSLKDFIGTNYVCPSGGIYIIGDSNEDPTCSIGGPGHSL